jgi:predicted enzyme related to lactoylglutathione lyase
MSNPIVHLEVVGQDGGKLMSFYSDLFGWQLDANNPQNYGVGQLDDSVGVGVGPAPEGPGGATFYIGVDDVAAALAKAEELGGSRVMGPETIMERMVLGQFKDPEGNMIGLIQGG